MRTDIIITGQWGLYAVAPASPKGMLWLATHCQEGRGRHTWRSGSLIVEGSVECRGIVIGMDLDGLSVTVNGVSMAGFAAREAS